jgi:hypothetical protein
MVKKDLTKIFLSASIPNKERNAKYHDTADIVAIRDAVRALATVVIPKTQLIWGGHPAITPLIRYILSKMDTDLKEHVTIYQSDFFRKFFPEDNGFFENIEIIPANKDRDSSLLDMRNAMMANDFKAGVFIGGMEGVEDEFSMFREMHPNALVLPVSSTGAAAKIIYNELYPKPDERLLTDYAYMALFRDLLQKYID